MQKGGNRMYRILVVDDEAIIREGIKCLFDYEALGFVISDEAATGEQAYNKIIAQQPDVVLMDIRIPGISGLDVAKKVRKEGYTGKIIIISSFTDFQYAKEAMRQGVETYITKPIDEDELESILKEYKQRLDLERETVSATQHYRQKARTAILRDICLNTADFSQLNLQDLLLNADKFRIVIADRYLSTDPDPQNSFQELLCIANNGNTAYDHFLLHDHHVYLLKGEATLQRFLERLLYCRQEPASALSRLFLSIGRMVEDPTQIVSSYQDAAQLHRRAFFIPQNNHLLTGDALEGIQTYQTVISNENLQHYSKKILDCIQSFNRQVLLQTMTELQDALCHASDTVDSVKLFLTTLCLQIKNQMNHLYPNDSIPFSANAEILSTIEHSRYLYEIIDLFREEFETIMSAIGTSNRDSILEEILHYIHHNYAQNITLEDISQLFGYNRSYLGKIFSKKMGQNFNSYIDQVRIEKSKELLLQDDSKVYSIAAKVGYRNVDYFHIKFKKYVGISPAEFRKQNKQQVSLCSPEENTEKSSLF